jgi:pterin-4a-carbinolamine dehydratase
MKKVTLIGEKMNHHPIRTNVYKKVHIIYCTHIEDYIIRGKDRKMANAIDKIKGD